MRPAVWILALIVSLVPSIALAHDDPVVTVRVMCDGFNVLDIDQVLGEISDSATIQFDRTVQGTNDLHAWVKQQMDDDLRIEILEIGTPQQLPDGYTLTWTARFSRQDWRKAGIASRKASSLVVIHNGRITQWTAALDTGVPISDAAGLPVSITSSVPNSPGSMIPEVFGIPVTLLLAAAVALGGGSFLARSVLRR
jgi:hypothetical protein